MNPQDRFRDSWYSEEYNRVVGLRVRVGWGRAVKGSKGGGGDLGGETRWWEATGTASTKVLGRDEGVRNRKESRISSRYE